MNRVRLEYSGPEYELYKSVQPLLATVEKYLDVVCTDELPARGENND